MDLIWTTTICLYLSVGLTVSFPAEEQQPLPLVQQLQSLVDGILRTHADAPVVANSIQQTHGDTPVDVNSTQHSQQKDQSLYDARLAAWNSQWDDPPPSPGLTNVCENFCPKWCRKGPSDGQRECHFACTNLCDKKVWSLETH